MRSRRSSVSDDVQLDCQSVTWGHWEDWRSGLLWTYLCVGSVISAMVLMSPTGSSDRSLTRR